MRLGILPPRAAFHASLSGVVSAVLFVAIFGFGMGVPLCVALPTLPLFLTAFKNGITSLFYACFAAAALALMLAQGQGLLFYLGFIGLPALLLAPGALAGVPAGTLLTDLAFYTALANAGFVGHMVSRGGIEPVVAEALRQGFTQADPAVQAAVDQLAGHWAFLVVGASAWWWMLLVYVHAVLALWLVRLREPVTAPVNLGLRPFTLPLGLLGVLFVCAGGSFVTDANLAFGAKVLFIILLFPYFLLGVSEVHQRVHAWPHRGIVLFLLYFFTLSQGWPALVLACIGVFQQLKALTRHSSP